MSSFFLINYLLQFHHPVSQLFTEKYFSGQVEQKLTFSLQMKRSASLDQRVKSLLLWKVFFQIRPNQYYSINRWVTQQATFSLFYCQRMNQAGTINFKTGQTNLVSQPMLYLLPIETLQQYDYVKWKYKLRLLLSSKKLLQAEQFLVRPRYV